nr:hypothetical protein [Tanacetum cinerariifolium]
ALVIKQRKERFPPSKGMDQPLSSPEPLRTVDSIGPRDKNPLGTVAKTAESRGDHSLHIPRHDSTNTSVHNYVDIVDENEETNSLKLQSFVGPTKKNLDDDNT